MPPANPIQPLLRASRRLSQRVDQLTFRQPVTHVYNPLSYARKPHEAYIQAFARTRKKVLFLGMNPGPFGMAQTGVPFGEIAAVRDWMNIAEAVSKPKLEHPKRLVTGFSCPRSEVSGRRLWALFAQRYKSASDFFKDHFVVNYCPLAFLERSGRNFTPNKLPREEKEPLVEACDYHLREVVNHLQPAWLIGVGDYAFKCLDRLWGQQEEFQIGKIAHPSPASPAANKDWAGLVTGQLVSLGVWSKT